MCDEGTSQDRRTRRAGRDGRVPPPVGDERRRAQRRAGAERLARDDPRLLHRGRRGELGLRAGGAQRDRRAAVRRRRERLRPAGAEPYRLDLSQGAVPRVHGRLVRPAEAQGRALGAHGSARPDDPRRGRRHDQGRLPQQRDPALQHASARRALREELGGGAVQRRHVRRRQGRRRGASRRDGHLHVGGPRAIRPRRARRPVRDVDVSLAHGRDQGHQHRPHGADDHLSQRSAARRRQRRGDRPRVRGRVLRHEREREPLPPAQHQPVRRRSRLRGPGRPRLPGEQSHALHQRLRLRQRADDGGQRRRAGPLVPDGHGDGGRPAHAALPRQHRDLGRHAHGRARAAAREHEDGRHDARCGGDVAAALPRQRPHRGGDEHALPDQVRAIALRRSRARAGLTTLLAAAVAAAGAPAASAHATPEGSTPAAGAALRLPPASVAVRFSEPVETALGALRVYDARGAEVQAGRPFHPGGDSSALAVRLHGGLRAGGYTTTFRVVSAASHPATGGFPFGVGGRADAIGVSELLGRDGGGSVTAVALAGARGLQYLAIALAIGVLAVVVLVWTPALRDLATSAGAWRVASDRFAGRARGLLLAAAAIGACSASLAIGLQAATVEGVPLWSALEDAPQILSTRFGTVWALGALAWLAVFTIAEGDGAVIPVLRPATVGATGVALPGAGAWLPAAAVPILALALLPGLSGHAAAQDPAAVLLPANALHVLAAGAWIGGVATLVVALPAAARPLDAPDRAALLAGVLARFSTLALAAVCGLVAGGVVQSGWELGWIRDLAATAFGRTLAIKGLLVLALVACGAVNRRRIIPALGRAAATGAPDARTALSLRRTLRAEVLLGVAALAASGALAGQRPGITATRAPGSGSIDRPAPVRARPTEVGPRAVPDVSAAVRSP